MDAATFRLKITVATSLGDVTMLLPTSATDRVADLIARLIREFDLQGGPTAWELIFDGQPLPTDSTFGSALSPSLDTVSLILRPIEPHRTPRLPIPAAPAVAPPADLPRGGPSRGRAPGGYTHPPAAAAPPARAPAKGRSSSTARSEVALALEEDDDDEVRAAPAKSKQDRSTERRATVRYYSRMNPERVFPLLVMLTRQEVEKVVKRHVEQTATGPLTLAADVPLEIEPVLPGCMCYPPKVVTRLGSADDVFTFHVVPHVLGSVTGARVFIRQDHTTLAEIKLDIRVVQRTIVLVSALSALFLPTASAVLNHFGIDFTPKDGSNPYLAAMNFVFKQVRPELMMAALTALTGVLFWFTRPNGRDVFWDINTKPPGEKPAA
jgi:hypothetical protein